MMAGRVTNWGLVWLCIGAGIVSALQIGKAPPVILEIQADLGLDKVTAGWAISLISAVGMTIAAFVGVLAGVLGAKRVHLSGYLLIALGSGLGMTADSGSFLLFSRLVESLGFLAIIVSAPPLLQRVIAPADQGRVMGFWGCYMPGGMVIALVAAPTLAGLIGWRGLWGVLAGALGSAGALADARRSLRGTGSTGLDTGYQRLLATPLLAAAGDLLCL